MGENRGLAGIDNQTSTANSGIILRDDRSAIVELDPEHPGFRDSAYRERRNAIAQVALDYVPGESLPDIDYLEADHEVWRKVWESLEEAHQRYACEEYLEKSKLLDLPKDRIPQLSEVTAKTEALSGFRLEPVAGLVHPRVFLSNLGDGVFLSTQYIRHHSVPLYTPEPDVVHELVGHAAMLASEDFVRLSKAIGRAAKESQTDEELDLIGRVYWYTIEFGVLREKGEVKAYGAGLLSSFGELDAMKKAELHPFDIAEMEKRDYDVTQYQPVLYCAESFDEMIHRLEDYFQI